jgi:hypothetical protein
MYQTRLTQEIKQVPLCEKWENNENIIKEQHMKLLVSKRNTDERVKLFNEETEKAILGYREINYLQKNS